ncbi:MAG: peptide deformylase [Myxococcota bacterium]
MAILKVAQLGHPVLRMISREVTVEEIASPVFQQFCDDLLDTMLEYDGTGLAAPQVHTSLRVVVLSLDGEREPEFFVNPEITVLTTDTSTMMEGCLSVEGMRARVARPNKVRIEALDRDGKPKAYELEGFPAVVVQHECDHLDGVVYVDRCDTRTLAFMTEYRRFGPVDEWLEEQEFTGPDLTEQVSRESDPDDPPTDEIRRLEAYIAQQTAMEEEKTETYRPGGTRR